MQLTGSSLPGRLLAVAVVCAVVVSVRAQRADTIESLFDQYLHGNADAAVAAFAQWPSSRREAESGSNPISDDPWIDAAFALFHTETGFRTATFGGSKNGRASKDPDIREVHFRTSYELMDHVATVAHERHDERLLAVAKSWCILAASWSYRSWWWSGYNPQFDDLIRRQFPDDAEILLLQASLDAMRMGPDVEEHDGYHLAEINGEGLSVNGVKIAATPRVHSTSHGLFNLDWTEPVERDLNRALKLSPDLVEARLRLGRFLFLMDRKAAAIEVLEQTIRDAKRLNVPYVGYLGGLFLAELRESAGDTEGAVTALQEASSFLPTAPAARIALGRLHIQTGRVDEGWVEIRRIFGDGAVSGETGIDPWVDYPWAERWQLPLRLASLRLELKLSQPAAALSTLRPARSVTSDNQASAAAGAPVTGSDDPRARFRSLVHGVRVDVYVTDGGRPVTGLTAEDFDVRDNGVKQKVDSAGAVNRLSVAVVSDVSSSVSGNYWPAMMAGGHAVADALKPGDLTSILTFDEKVSLRVRHTSSADAIYRELSNLRQYPSHSVVWDATVAGAAMATETEGRPVVVLISDLRDNASWLIQSPFVRRPGDGRAAVADLFRRTGVLLDVLPLSDPGVAPRGRGPSDALGDVGDSWTGNLGGPEITDKTGGLFLSGNQSKYTTQIAEQFANLRSGYVITFTPTGVRQDDGWHKITVELHGGKGKVTARPGYFAGEVRQKK